MQRLDCELGGQRLVQQLVLERILVDFPQLLDGDDKLVDLALDMEKRELAKGLPGNIPIYYSTQEGKRGGEEGLKLSWATLSCLSITYCLY